MINIVIVALVVVVLFIAIRRAVGTWRQERDCCSGAKASGGSVTRTALVADTNEDHYPYRATFDVSGMHCANCAAHVEDALNAIPGTWATVDLDAQTALVRSKEQPDAQAYRTAVEAAGYGLAEAS